MIFKSPHLLWLLLILPVLWKLVRRAETKKRVAAEKLRGKPAAKPGRFSRRALLNIGAFGALILALARPVWNPHAGPAAARGRDLVIALDISRSMLAADVFPNRLDAVKIALFESLEHLRGQRIGLITFAGAASVRVPLTLDHRFVHYMLERAQPAAADVGSTSLQAAIEKAIDVVLNESKKGQQDLIMFTDGEDYLSDIEQTAAELRDCGARVLIIGIGDPTAGAKIPALAKTNAWMQYQGEDVITRLEESTLIQLAAASPNVTYYPARTRPFNLAALYQRMLEQNADLPADGTGRIVYTEGFPFLIALALLLGMTPHINRRQ